MERRRFLVTGTAAVTGGMTLGATPGETNVTESPASGAPVWQDALRICVDKVEDAIKAGECRLHSDIRKAFENELAYDFKRILGPDACPQYWEADKDRLKRVGTLLGRIAASLESVHNETLPNPVKNPYVDQKRLWAAGAIVRKRCNIETKCDKGHASDPKSKDAEPRREYCLHAAFTEEPHPAVPPRKG